MKLLNQVTPETVAIIWNMPEDNIITNDYFNDLNYLFDNSLVHTFSKDVINDSAYFFQTTQFEENLYLLAFKKKEKSLDELLKKFNELNLNHEISKDILVIDPTKKIKKDNIKNSVKKLNISEVKFIS